MTVYAKIENGKLITAYNGYNGITGFADNIEVMIANGFQSYTEEEIAGYYAGIYKIINGILTDISNTNEYKNQYKNEMKKIIKDKYKDIMNEYVCAKVKQDLFTTAEYQTMINDMYAEIGAL